MRSRSLWNYIRKEAAITVGRWGPALAAGGAATAAGSALAQDTNQVQEPPKPQAVQVVETDGRDDADFLLSNEFVKPDKNSIFNRIAVTDKGRGYDIFVAEGLSDPENDDSDLKIGRFALSYPVTLKIPGIGTYKTTRFDLFGEVDRRDRDLNNWGFGVNTYGKIGELYLGLVLEGKHEERRETKERNDREIEYVKHDNTFLSGLLLGKDIEHNDTLYQPKLAIYNLDGVWTADLTHYMWFGENRNNILATSLTLGEDNVHEFRFNLGRFPLEPGTDWAGRIRGYTNFEGDWSLRGKFFLRPFVDHCFIIGPLSHWDGGDNDKSLVYNARNFPTQWEIHDFGFGPNALAIEVGYFHDGKTVNGGEDDSFYAGFTVRPFHLTGFTSNYSTDLIEQLIGNSFIGFRWDWTDIDGDSSDMYTASLGSYLEPIRDAYIGFSGNYIWMPDGEHDYGVLGEIVLPFRPR